MRGRGVEGPFGMLYSLQQQRLSPSLVARNHVSNCKCRTPPTLTSEPGHVASWGAHGPRERRAQRVTAHLRPPPSFNLCSGPTAPGDVRIRSQRLKSHQRSFLSPPLAGLANWPMYARACFVAAHPCPRRAPAGMIRSSLYGRRGVTSQTAAAAAAGGCGRQRRCGTGPVVFKLCGAST